MGEGSFDGVGGRVLDEFSLCECGHGVRVSAGSMYARSLAESSDCN